MDENLVCAELHLRRTNLRWTGAKGAILSALECWPRHGAAAPNICPSSVCSLYSRAASYAILSWLQSLSVSLESVDGHNM
jgi:hypothetical protein